MFLRTLFGKTIMDSFQSRSKGLHTGSTNISTTIGRIPQNSKIARYAKRGFEPIRAYGYIVVVPFISIVGIIAAVVCIIVFTKKQMRNSSLNIYLAGLSAVDILLLGSSTMVFSLSDACRLMLPLLFELTNDENDCGLLRLTAFGNSTFLQNYYHVYIGAAVNVVIPWSVTFSALDATAFPASRQFMEKRRAESAKWGEKSV
ncbi:hypothetical protein WR25_10832 [Diploscapter pachys]|uniref:G-protein coupled receptors family 1 profile domain-containing protein n=1 Tax=Diploscapter pachys TaxID=2018661 RepID=A0A2A2JB01_9BILA|nr:hypothetical protein WR25_10832 [Diploscapter pachys]